VLQQSGDGIRDHGYFPRRDEVDGVAPAPEGGQDRVKLRHDAFIYGRDLKARLLAQVGRYDAPAAALGHDADPLADKLRLGEQEARHVGHFVKGIGQDDIGLAAHGVKHGVTSRQRAGVGHGRACADGPGAALEEDDWLFEGDPAGCIQEPASLPQPLNVEAYDPRFIVSFKVLQVILDLQVSLVAGADKAAYADLAAVQTVRHGGPQVAALGYNGDAALPDLRRHHDGLHGRGIGAEDAHGIGPHDADAVFAGDGKHLLFQRCALRTGLAETGGDDHRGPYARGGAIPHRPGHQFLGHDDHGQVDGAGDNGKAFIHFPAEPGPSLGIDRINNAVEPPPVEVVKDVEPPLGHRG